eukprot:s788_g12.t1
MTWEKEESAFDSKRTAACNLARSVLPWVFQQVDRIGRIGELRLLKLLVESAMHRWMYTNMRVVGQGQFGTVMQSGVTLGNHGNLQVAIKHIPKQTNIQDLLRSLMPRRHSRLDHLCQIFDFGVEESCYWIVMKCYGTTLKRWREQLIGTLSDHLPVLLAIFKQILEAVAVLHKHDIVHYDLKCDNIMIEAAYKSSSPGSDIDDGTVAESDGAEEALLW